ncbi:MAG: aspartyl protease family protein [Nibricoccus sp.]
MTSTRTRSPAGPRRLLATARLVVWCLLFVTLISSGCSSVSRLYRRESRPGRTKLDARLVVVPAQIIGNHFIVETRWDKHGPWRFLVDTGSSVTLVSDQFASQYGFQQPATTNPPVRIRSANGGTVSLPAVNIKRLQLGDARFLNVPAFTYDCSELSAHFGMRIDGILGFPLFRDVVFSLDYPQSRLVITTAGPTPLLPGSLIPFNNERRTPIVTLTLGNETFTTLIDSGSDGPLFLNPFGLHPEFAYGPRSGGTVGTLTGDRPQQIGRLRQPLIIGTYRLDEPFVDLTDQLSSIGGEVLKHFCVTFDPPRNNVTFFRDSTAVIVSGARRSTGMSFAKTPAYWRVASVVPGSPAQAAGIQRGDLVARINGEPVSAWPLQRLDNLTRRATEITFTFLHGSKETPVILPTFELIP